MSTTKRKEIRLWVLEIGLSANNNSKEMKRGEHNVEMDTSA